VLSDEGGEADPNVGSEE